MERVILEPSTLIPSMYVHSAVTSWIYIVCEDIDKITPTHRVVNGEIIDHYVDAKYSISFDDIKVCETIFTRKLNKHIHRERVLNELGIF